MGSVLAAARVFREELSTLLWGRRSGCQRETHSCMARRTDGCQRPFPHRSGRYSGRCVCAQRALQWAHMAVNVHSRVAADATVYVYSVHSGRDSGRAVDAHVLHSGRDSGRAVDADIS